MANADANGASVVAEAELTIDQLLEVGEGSVVETAIADEAASVPPLEVVTAAQRLAEEIRATIDRRTEDWRMYAVAALHGGAKAEDAADVADKLLVLEGQRAARMRDELVKQAKERVGQAAKLQAEASVAEAARLAGSAS
jgi:hypothetical protein